MNDLEKRSFYSFLGLYIFSSLLFILLVGYWYYIAEKNALENETYYKLEHIADMRSGDIIMAHMHDQKMKSREIPENIQVVLIDTNGTLIEGTLIDSSLELKPGYYLDKGYNILISDAPREHLNIRYVVVQSNMLSEQLSTLKSLVWKMLLLVFVLMIIVAWILSKLFMRPVRQRVKQIERFINDITHELNTPITSLKMSTDLALKQEKYTEKTVKNISISTKQLYDIYRSLTYLNFSNEEASSEILDIKEVLEKSIDYYQALAEIKHIEFKVFLEETKCVIPEAQLTLLLGNLIGNAIKYSSPHSKIEISLQERTLSIKDYGIGIEPEQQKVIFEKFKRGTAYSGGFGVGLNIVKSICDKYHIAIALDSVPDEGTEFKLHFPKR
jgi:two-component system OmpR family sensor kinase